MVPSRSIPKVGVNRNGSFGGHNRPRSSSQSQDPAARVHSKSNISEGNLSSLSSASANLSLQDGESPELDEVGTCPSSATGNPANPNVTSRRGGSFSRVQMKDMPSTKLHVPSTSLQASTSSEQIHLGTEQKDHWSTGANEENCLLQKVASKNKKKGPTRKHATEVGEDENGASASQDRIYFLGRLLSSILRHKATYLNLQIRNDGYVVVSDMLKLNVKTRPGIPLSVYTMDDVLKAVERDSKQRFTLLTEDGVLLIRANQGHSIKTVESDKLLKPIVSADEIPVCVHGTLMGNLSSIMKTGLKKMGRNHVHFASGLPRENGVISGMRHTSEVLMYLDSKKALQDGMKLYMSSNGVILTEGFDGVVPPEYFERIAKWDNGKITPLPLHAKA